MAKEGKAAAVPRLRFPAFIGQTLREVQLSDVTTESTIRNDKGLPSTSVMGVSKVVGIVPMEERIISSDIARYKLVRKDWFAYNPMRLNIGSIARWRGDADILVSPDYVVFRCLDACDSGIEPDYLDHFRQSVVWDDFVSEGGDGGVRVRIYYKDLARLELVLPAPAEQQKIADCLTSLDELIAAQGRKVEALKIYKRGLMQQLFPREGETLPRLRFPEFRDAPDWIEKPLGDLVDLLSGYPFDGKDIVVDRTGVPLMRGINVTEGAVRHSIEIDRYYLGSIDGLEKYRLEQNDLVIGMDGSKVGKNSALISEPDAGSLLIQRVARLRATSVPAIKFVFQLVHSPRFHAYVDRINTSSGIPHISAKQIKDYSICSTGEEEQKRIAECLSSLDDGIAAEAEKLGALKVHKKGLMQQLFPVPEEV